MPVVLRVSVGSKYGAQHSQDWTSLCAHIPGLKVVFPVTPYDAKGLMNAALSGTDPVVFFESQRIYDIGEMFHLEGVPEGYYEVPIGEPDIKKQGKDITILTVGATLYRALDAAKILEEKWGLSAEVIDARTIVPFNYEKVLESVKKTGRILLSSDACERGSHLKDMAQTISELAFDYLDAPPVVVGAGTGSRQPMSTRSTSSHSRNGSSMPSMRRSCLWTGIRRQPTGPGTNSCAGKIRCVILECVLECIKRGAEPDRPSNRDLNHVQRQNRLQNLESSGSDQAGQAGKARARRFCQQPYSYHLFLFAYSPTKAVWMAYNAGLTTAGIMDHDSISGAREFIEAGRILGLATTIGVEFRADLSETPLKGKRINNPDQVSAAYVALHGIPHTQIDKVAQYLAPYRKKRNRRNVAMTARLNIMLAKYGINLDFANDIVPLSQARKAGALQSGIFCMPCP